MNPLLELLEHGQSYWLDNLTREMLRNGELERRVREEGLRGVTSNPAIFSKAISGGGGYDEQIEKLAREGRGLEETFERIAVDDIRDACDVLRPVHEESDGRDGFVSLEVSPHLAHDTRGSVEEARRLFRAVDRPNLLIKIPGTPAGVPAIEELLYEGVNVNVTLLFSVDAYEEVARAYLRALERRREEGASLDDVASVASFFLSRIDVLLDRILGHRILPGRSVDGAAPEELLGEAAVANAKLAYRRFLELFSGERWETLSSAGARPQRMLWASTSTKNPLYRDVRYVEPLVGEHTVNTLPERTIDAFADHGRVAETVQEELEEARRTMEALEEVGVDFDHVTAQLLHEGVEKFIDPYDRLMATLAERRRELVGAGGGRVEEAAGELEADRDEALEALDERRFVRRLHARDATLWADRGEDTAPIRRRLGWLDAGDRFRDRLSRLAELAVGVSEEGIRDVVLLGTGGSVGAARALHGVLGAAPDHPELTVLDAPHPEAVARVEEAVDPGSALFVVASKSGTTAETMGLYRHFWRRAEEAPGGDPASRFVAVTDDGTPLAREARERGFRELLLNPEDIGGRYSALSLFGLAPAALIGAGPGDLLDRAGRLARECDPALPAGRHPGARLGALLGMAGRKGRDKVTLFTSDGLEAFRPWLEQLLAESLGKEGRGLVPVAGETPVVPGAYGDDRLFVHLSLDGEEEPGLTDALDELAEAGHPVVRIELPSPLDVAGEFHRWELAVATAGAVLGVNPFDQPDVEAAKAETRELLDELEATGALPGGEGEPVDDGIRLHGDTSWLPADGAGLLHRVADAVPEGGYLALLPWFPLEPALSEALEALRRSLWTRAGSPVTVCRGPAYLHATGQLHKGGPEGGVFVLLTGAGTGRGPDVPGTGHGFGQLHRAQALGDHRALERRGRRVLRLELDDPADGLRRLHEALRASGEAAARAGAAPPAG